MPGQQLWHATAPDSSWKYPAVHAVQAVVALPGAAWPGLHGAQVVLDVAPTAVLNVPGQHGFAATCPAWSW